MIISIHSQQRAVLKKLLMRKLLISLLLFPLLSLGQKRSVDVLIDVVPRFDAPYCSQYDPEEVEKFYGYYPKNKLMADITDTTAIEKNVIYAEILDRDAQLRLDSGLVKNHLLKPGERLLGSDSHTDFFAYFGEAFVIDVNGYYGMIVEKVAVNNGKLTSEKYLCTVSREGKLIDKYTVLHSPEKGQTIEIPVKVCIKDNTTIELTLSSGSTKKLTISNQGKISDTP